MKTVLIFLFTIFLFTACNNNNGMMGGGGWSSAQKNQFMQPCVNGGQTKEICSCVLQKLMKKYPNPNQIPEATASQIGQQLSLECMNGGNMGNMDDNKNNNDDNMGNNDNDNKNNNALDNMFDDKNKNKDDNNNNDNFNNNEGGWTKQQHDQYVYGCAQAAQQNFGYSQKQANSYCDCLTRKVESQFTFQQASKMTAQDFSTQEWENARQECQPSN